MSAEQTVKKAVASLVRTAERMAVQSRQDMAVKQETLRAEFEAVLASESLEAFEQQHSGFVQQHGQDQWDRQARLAMARARKEQGNV